MGNPDDVDAPTLKSGSPSVLSPSGSNVMVWSVEGRVAHLVEVAVPRQCDEDPGAETEEVPRRDEREMISPVRSPVREPGERAVDVGRAHSEAPASHTARRLQIRRRPADVAAH